MKQKTFDEAITYTKAMRKKETFLLKLAELLQELEIDVSSTTDWIYDPHIGDEIETDRNYFFYFVIPSLANNEPPVYVEIDMKDVVNYFNNFENKLKGENKNG